MAFPPAFLEELRHRLTLSQIVGRKVKLIRRGREHSGLCPFHNEKSPSFTVNDDKGFFHCFGCGAHGDVIGFVMRNENLPFPEAIERLAGEAGLEVPRLDPADRERATRTATLADALEQAASWYQAQLETSAGREAKRYLTGRGLSEATIARFRLGYAPGGWRALKQAMIARNLPEDLLVAAGLIKKPDDGGRESFDYLRERVTFPITDRRGRVIAFGGRILGDGEPKYLNSPETELFHKGASLYNLAMARQAARAAGTVIVVEGYMDVIALAQAGFEHAVAPLGTALTETQIELLWQLADEPILCFDGDAAGLRAGYRAVDRALPLLKPGKSLRFLLLREAKDPDELIKAKGAAAMREQLAGALPLTDMLWRRQGDGRVLDTPEKRAAFEADLFKAVNDIADDRVKGYYRDHIRDRLAEERRRPRQEAAKSPRPPGRPWRGGRGPAEPVLSPAQLAPPANVNAAAGDADLLLAWLNHPGLVEWAFEDVAGWPIADARLRALRDQLVAAVLGDPDLDSKGVRDHLKGLGMAETIAMLDQRRSKLLDRRLGADATPEDARAAFDRIRQAKLRDARLKALAEARIALEQDMNDENLARLTAIQKEIEESGHGIG